jgi:hypothetical protein
MEHFPSRILVFMGAFAACFKANNFLYFQGFMLSYMLLGQTRKCVTNISRVCFFINRHVSGMERFLSEYQWDMPGIRTCLVNLIRDRFGDGLLIHGAYLLQVDTYLVGKVRGKMPGVQNWHDHSGNPDRGNRLIGHHWAVAGLIGFGTVGGTLLPLCFPVLTGLISGQLNPLGFIVDSMGNAQLMNFQDTVCPMTVQLKGMLGPVPVRTVADAYFSKAPFINRMLSEGVHVISRMRQDAVGRDDPEPLPPGKKRRGRKSKKPPKGKKQKLHTLPKYFPTETVTVSIYGKMKELKVVCRDLWITGVESQKVRIVVVKTKGRPVIFVSTDLLLTPVQIIEIYARRFMGEIVIRDLKQYFGIGDYQCTGLTAMLRHTALAVTGFCLWRTAAADEHASWLNPKEKSAPLSFGRISRSLRGFVMSRIFQNSAVGADFSNSVRIPKEIISLIV